MFTLKKIFIGSGGGGCHFVANLYSFLKNLGHDVIFNFESNIDIIIVIDPRKNRTNKYSIDNIIKYKSEFPNVKIIHRVNECDIKREISINIEPLLLKAMNISDHVVFVSKWLQNYFVKKYKPKLKSYSYITSGCNTDNFYPKIDNIIKSNNKVKIITHHMSTNYLKGFHIYDKLDKLLSNRKDIEFTFVGNYHERYKPKNIKLIKPTHGKQLGNILRNHDIYLTATQNEPCGMHFIEGQSCGLPLLFCSGGGSTSELCSQTGEEFKNINNIFIALNKIKENYKKYVENIDYNYLGSDRCNNEYFQLIQKLVML